MLTREITDLFDYVDALKEEVHTEYTRFKSGEHFNGYFYNNSGPDFVNGMSEILTRIGHMTKSPDITIKFRMYNLREVLIRVYCMEDFQDAETLRSIVRRFMRCYSDCIRPCESGPKGHYLWKDSKKKNISHSEFTALIALSKIDGLLVELDLNNYEDDLTLDKVTRGRMFASVIKGVDNIKAIKESLLKEVTELYEVKK